MKTKAQRRAWWHSLSPEEQEEYITTRAARKAASPSAEALEAMARCDLANERGIFMREVPRKDVAARVREMTTKEARQ